jgi:hypothetical protein
MKPLLDALPKTENRAMWDLYFNHILINAASAYFEKAVKITSDIVTSDIWLDPVTHCSSYSYNQLSKTPPEGTQLALILTLGSGIEQLFLAETCFRYNKNVYGRTIIGSILVSYKHMTIPFEDTIIQENHISLFMHEILHFLAFDKETLEYMGTAPTQTGIYPFPVIKTNIGGLTFSRYSQLFQHISYMKEHFGCYDLELDKGIYFHPENHFATQIYGPSEIMLAYGREYIRQISMFTLTLLADMPWYDIDFTWAEPNNWQKGTGCGVFYADNNNNPEIFCKATEEKKDICDTEYRGPAPCTTPKEQFWDSFSFVAPLRKKLCPSRKYCFNSENPQENHRKKSQCFSANCDVSGMKPIIYFTVNNLAFECDTKDKELFVNSSMTVLCPDPEIFCQNRQTCRKNCFGRGKCIDGFCQCDYPFYGDACHSMRFHTISRVLIDNLSQFKIGNAYNLDDQKKVIVDIVPEVDTTSIYWVMGPEEGIQHRIALSFEFFPLNKFLIVVWAVSNQDWAGNSVKFLINDKPISDSLVNEIENDLRQDIFKKNPDENWSEWHTAEFSLNIFLANATKEHILEIKVRLRELSIQDSALYIINPVSSQNILALTQNELALETNLGQKRQIWKFISIYDDYFYIVNQEDKMNPKGQYLKANIKNKKFGFITSISHVPMDDNFLWKVQVINNVFYIQAFFEPLAWTLDEDYIISLKPLKLRNSMQAFNIYPN